jgi:putative glutamine amidotransferase
MKALVAVTTDLKHVDPYDWHATPAPYINAAVDSADVMPLLVPSLAEKLDIGTLLDRVDGVLVTGSRSNVHPSNYKVGPTDDHAPFDPARDATTLPLIRAAIERGVPLLAICRGIQELNVALGGSITAAFQKNRKIEGHSYPWEGTLDERFELAHGIRVKDGSCLDTILRDHAAAGSIPVNSLHTQALDQLGERIVVEAEAEDGTVEAVSVSGAPGFVIGVQWHPEYWAVAGKRKDGPSAAIFKAFGEAARAHAAGKSNRAAAA